MLKLIGKNVNGVYISEDLKEKQNKKYVSYRYIDRKYNIAVNIECQFDSYEFIAVTVSFMSHL